MGNLIKGDDMKSLLKKIIEMGTTDSSNSFVYKDKNPESINHIAKKINQFTYGKRKKR
ncbi:hypothetical protein N752_29895 [Desulforamulus aquiferis]|nr:hypothetical protein [Desulforamulus aquiferis]RYD01516.1 hypothetical protein N752_29895 [Desulforamulus aquiferis]